MIEAHIESQKLFIPTRLSGTIPQRKQIKGLMMGQSNGDFRWQEGSIETH